MNDEVSEQLHRARALARDNARPEIAEAGRQGGGLTARERIDALVDPSSFMESGVLAGADNAPAAGFVAGIGRVSGHPVAVGSFYPSLDEAQLPIVYQKVEHLISLATKFSWPLALFLDGGELSPPSLGGPGLAGPNSLSNGYSTYDGLAGLSGWTPIVAVVAGQVFGGPASMIGFSDVCITTRASRLALASWADGESDEAIGGPIHTHEQTGVVDIVAENDLAAAALARQYLSYFVIRRAENRLPPQHDIRGVVPDNRRGMYDMRKLLEALVDADTILELRPNNAKSAITALARLGGHSIAVIANQPMSAIGGAIDAAAVDKFARFLQLADAFDLPIVSLMDCPGFMVGPDVERTGLGRKHSRAMFVQTHRTVPLLLLQIRKAYGLGAGMMGGMFQPTDLRLAWPSIEGGGGLSDEGAATLALRKEWDATNADAATRRRMRDELAGRMRERTSFLEPGRKYRVDEVIDPEETRERMIAMLDYVGESLTPDTKKHFIDAG